jgi:hypothetical protein
MKSRVGLAGILRRLAVLTRAACLVGLVWYGPASTVSAQDAGAPRKAGSPPAAKDVVPDARGDVRRVSGVYRVDCSERDGFRIWIVDGAVVRRSVDPVFLYGGNGQRYLYVPPREIWIDHAITAEEFGYTVAHELRERELMARQGLSYADAHDQALVLERRMRLDDRRAAEAHEEGLPRVSPTDSNGRKAIAGLPDAVALRRIYRAPLGKRDGLEVWVVDGAAVRRDIFPDFGLGGNDLSYRFIPPREVWVDDQISCEETEFTIAAELRERALMARGVSYGDAYEAAIKEVGALREKSARAASQQPPVLVPRTIHRETGTGDERPR